MSVFIVAENFEGLAEDRIPEGGNVVDKLGDDARSVITVEFDAEHEEAGHEYSRIVNGSTYGARWTAGEHARHVFTGSP